MQDFLGDMFTRIKNGHRARLGAVILHSSTPQLCLRILNILTEEGYIRGYYKILNNKKKGSSFAVLLKYDTNGVPVIQAIFRVSKPTRRVYVSIKSLWKPKNTAGIFIVSTIEGLMVDRDARKRNLGGEVICGIY